MTESRDKVKIQNLHGEFVQLAFADLPIDADRFFANRDDVSFELPDEGIKLIGSEIKDFIGKQFFFGEKTWVMSHTPAIRIDADGAGARATWYATVFQITQKESTDALIQGTARFDADLVKEGDDWKYLNLQFYYMMTLEPYKYGEGFLPFNNTGAPFTPCLDSCCSAIDFVAISKLIDRFSVARREDGIEAFSNTKEVKISMPLLLDRDYNGRSEVEALLKDMAGKEAANYPYVLTIPMLTTPIINVEGDNAEGTWIVLSHDCKGPAFGETKETAYAITALQSARVRFTKESGEWKIVSIEYVPVLILPKNDILLSSYDNTILKIGWIDPPAKQKGLTEADTEDILKLEEYVCFWASGLRYRSEAPFYYTRLAIDRPEMLSYQVGVNEKTIGIEAVTKKIFEMVNKFCTLQPKAPGNHIGTTPVIELSDDRQTAEGVWLDYGWTTVAQVFGIKEPPFKANAAIGRYHFKFIKIDGFWKVYYFHWTPFFRTGMWEFGINMKGWCQTTSTRRFPLPLDRYVYENDESKRGEKIVLEPSSVPCPYEEAWTGGFDDMPKGR